MSPPDPLRSLATVGFLAVIGYSGYARRCTFRRRLQIRGRSTMRLWGSVCLREATA
jgi:hypothetical protein